MQNLRIPGVLWVIVLVLLLTVIRIVVDQYGVNPLYFDLAVVAVIAILKAANLGTKELEELLEVICILQRQVDRREAELSPDTSIVKTMSMVVPTPKEYPINYFVRWLVG